MLTFRHLLPALFALSLGGCGDTAGDILETTSACSAGDSRACGCADGAAGTQSCLADGSGFDACACGCIPECGSRACGIDPACGTASCGMCAVGLFCSEDGSCLGEGFAIVGRTHPRATVELSIGDGTLTTLGGADGRYRVDLTDLSQDFLVILRARGGSSEGHNDVELVSVVGMLSELRERAGDDHIVDETEHSGTWIDGLSTVRAATLATAEGRLPESTAEMAAREPFMNQRLNASSMLDGAVVLDQIAAGASGFSLPAGFTTTWRFALDLDALSETARRLQPDPLTFGPLTAPREALLTRSSRFTRFSPEGTFMIRHRLLRGDDIGEEEGEWRLDFQADGTGRIHFEPSRGIDAPVDFSWSAVSSGVRVTFGFPVAWQLSLTTEEVVAEVDPGLASDVRNALGEDGLTVDGLLESWTFRRIGEGRAAEWLARMDEVALPLDTLLAPFGITTAAVTRTSFGEALLWLSREALPSEPLKSSEVVGTWAMPIIAPAPYDVGAFGIQVAEGQPLGRCEFLSFAADGTGRVDAGGGASPTQLSWQIDASGALDITFADGSRQLARRLVSSAGQRGFLQSFAWTSELTDYGWAGPVDPSFRITEAILRTPPGHYWQSILAGQESLGFVIEAAGAVSQAVETEDESAPFEVYPVALGWRIEDGDAYLELSRSSGGGVGRCREGDLSCLAEQRRRWRPIALVDGDLHVLETRTWHRDWRGLRMGAYTYDVARSAWVDDDGIPLDVEDRVAVFPPRYNVYRLQPLR